MNVSNSSTLNQISGSNILINNNQNNSLNSIGVSSLSGSSFGNSLKTTDISGAEIEWESDSLGTAYYTYTTHSRTILSSESPYYSGYAAEFDDVSYDFYINSKTSTDLSDSDILEQMASKYADLRNNILENYSGEEAEERLTQLDKAYEDIIDINVSSVFEGSMRNALHLGYVAKAAQRLMQGLKHLHSNLGFSSKFSCESYAISFDSSISNKVWSSENTLQLAKKAVQYILEGNSAPVTDEEKEAFNEYISEGTDGTIGNLSYSDLKAAASICNSINQMSSSAQNRSDFDNVYNLVNSSNFSDEVKTLFNNALYGIKISNSDTAEADNTDFDEKINEIIEKMAAKSLEKSKLQADSSISGEEKYSMYIKSAKQNAAIDTSLDEIINEIIIANQRFAD